MFKARGGFGGIALCIVFNVSGPRRPGFSASIRENYLFDALFCPKQSV